MGTVSVGSSAHVSINKTTSVAVSKAVAASGESILTSQAIVKLSPGDTITLQLSALASIDISGNATLVVIRLNWYI